MVKFQFSWVNFSTVVELQFPRLFCFYIRPSQWWAFSFTRRWRKGVEFYYKSWEVETQVQRSWANGKNNSTDAADCTTNETKINKCNTRRQFKMTKNKTDDQAALNNEKEFSLDEYRRSMPYWKRGWSQEWTWCPPVFINWSPVRGKRIHDRARMKHMHMSKKMFCTIWCNMRWILLWTSENFLCRH